MSEPSAVAVSIVVPCFNAEATVVRALDSIAAQEGGDSSIEVLVVDDGSSDGSASVVAAYFAGHPSLRGRLVRLEANSGVSVARNAGLEAARGEFVLFLDADDELKPDCCRRLLACQKADGADIVACNALRLFVDGRQKAYSSEHGKRLFSGEDFPLQTACHSLFDTSCAKLYRREMLIARGIRFQPGLAFGEDTLFANAAALAASVISVDFDHCGYVYQDNLDSCSNTIDVRRRLASLERVLHGLTQCLDDKRSPLLLRKACECLWSVRKFAGGQRREILPELVGSPLWREVLFPVITAHGKWKHRLCAWLLDRKRFWGIGLW